MSKRAFRKTLNTTLEMCTAALWPRQLLHLTIHMNTMQRVSQLGDRIVRYGVQRMELNLFSDK